MPDGVFYIIAYVAPAILSIAMGASLLGRVAHSPRRVLGRVWIALWCAASLFTVAAGLVAGRLYSYISQGQPPDPTLPLRPGVIMIVLMAVQGVIGWVFLRTLRTGREGGPTTR